VTEEQKEAGYYYQPCTTNMTMQNMGQVILPVPLHQFPPLLLNISLFFFFFFFFSLSLCRSCAAARRCWRRTGA
jgi:hypothetical protein